MRFLLDTNICIYAINRRPALVIEAFQRHFDEGLGISAVTAAELHYGVERTGSERNRRALLHFLAPLEVAPFDDAAAVAFGRLRAWLAAQGTPIGPFDTQIAAHALALGVTLVTHNVREFERVPGLRIADWAV